MLLGILSKYHLFIITSLCNYFGYGCILIFCMGTFLDNKSLNFILKINTYYFIFSLQHYFLINKYISNLTGNGLITNFKLPPVGRAPHIGNHWFKTLVPSIACQKQKSSAYCHQQSNCWFQSDATASSHANIFFFPFWKEITIFSLFLSFFSTASRPKQESCRLYKRSTWSIHCFTCPAKRNLGRWSWGIGPIVHAQHWKRGVNTYNTGCKGPLRYRGAPSEISACPKWGHRRMLHAPDFFCVSKTRGWYPLRE